MRDLSDYQEKYRTEPGEKNQVQLRRKHVIDIMSRYPHNNIIEVGCGLDPLFMHYSDYETMTVVEPGDYFINHARELSDHCKKKVICIEGYFEEASDVLQKDKQKYDYIIVSSLLHELEDPVSFLNSLKKVSSMKTVIHINVPNAYSLHRIIAKKMGIIKDIHELSFQQIQMQRCKTYDMDSLVELVTGVGFEVIEKGTFIPKFFTGKQMDRILEAGIIDEEYNDALDQVCDCFPDYGSELFIQIRKSDN